jgi:hypothetical protein
MGLRARILWLIVQGFFAAPLRYFERRIRERRQHELELARVNSESQARVIEALGRSNIEMVRELAAPMQANAQVMQTWLEGFKTVQIPTAQVITDETELGWEAEMAKEVLKRQQAEDHELLKGHFDAFPAELNEIPWDAADGRPAPPIAPTFFEP